MNIDVLSAAVVGSAVGWLVPRFFTKTVGTRYRTERDCKDCETRHAVQEIKTLVTELAIRAGVPAHEVSRFAGGLHRRKTDGSDG